MLRRACWEDPTVERTCGMPDKSRIEITNEFHYENSINIFCCRSFVELRSFPVRSRPLLSRFKSNVRNYSRPSYVIDAVIMPVCVFTRKRITNSLSAGLVLGQLSILLNKARPSVPSTRWILFLLWSQWHSLSREQIEDKALCSRYWERRLFSAFQQMFPRRVQG